MNRIIKFSESKIGEWAGPVCFKLDFWDPRDMRDQNVSPLVYKADTINGVRELNFTHKSFLEWPDFYVTTQIRGHDEAYVLTWINASYLTVMLFLLFILKEVQMGIHLILLLSFFKILDLSKFEVKYFWLSWLKNKHDSVT